LLESGEKVLGWILVASVVAIVIVALRVVRTCAFGTCWELAFIIIIIIIIIYLFIFF